MRPMPTTEACWKRFWSKVDKNQACWLWTGGKCSGGYGKFMWGNIKAAHRLAYEYCNNGPIPAGLFVLHKCDTPACVNPEHLYLGTHEDNMADRRARKHRIINPATGRP